MSAFQGKKFKDLQKKWYAKLAEDGFEDIEDQDQKHLKAWHSAYFQIKYTPCTFEAKQHYFEMAREFVWTHPFKTKQNRRIWILHSRGLSLRQIAEKRKTKVCRVFKLIKRLREIMIKKRQSS